MNKLFILTAAFLGLTFASCQNRAGEGKIEEKSAVYSANGKDSGIIYVDWNESDPVELRHELADYINFSTGNTYLGDYEQMDQMLLYCAKELYLGALDRDSINQPKTNVATFKRLNENSKWVVYSSVMFDGYREFATFRKKDGRRISDFLKDDGGMETDSLAPSINDLIKKYFHKVHPTSTEEKLLEKEKEGYGEWSSYIPRYYEGNLHLTQSGLGFFFWRPTTEFTIPYEEVKHLLNEDVLSLIQSDEQKNNKK